MDTPSQILVHNHKGGTGKTMIAVHLARYLAEQGREWCLWDADDQANAMTWTTKHQWDGTESLQVTPDHGAPLVATIDAAEATGRDRLIVDTPPSSDALEHVGSHAELSPETMVVCPVGGRLSIDGAVKVAEEVAAYGCRLILVSNLTDAEDPHARDEIGALEEMAEMDKFGAEVFQLTIPRNDKYMRKAEKRGIPVWEIPHAGQTYTAKALKAFCEWIASGAPTDNNPPTTPGGGDGPVSQDLKDRLW